VSRDTVAIAWIHLKPNESGPNWNLDPQAGSAYTYVLYAITVAVTGAQLQTILYCTGLYMGWEWPHVRVTTAQPSEDGCWPRRRFSRTLHYQQRGTVKHPVHVQVSEYTRKTPAPAFAKWHGIIFHTPNMAHVPACDGRRTSLCWGPCSHARERGRGERRNMEQWDPRFQVNKNVIIHKPKS
jgi:hypothetical protein